MPWRSNSLESRCRALIKSPRQSSRARTRSRAASWLTLGIDTDVTSSKRSNRDRCSASRASVLTRSPALTGAGIRCEVVAPSKLQRPSLVRSVNTGASHHCRIDRAGDSLLGNPRTWVSGAPARNPQLNADGHPYRLVLDQDPLQGMVGDLVDVVA